LEKLLDSLLLVALSASVMPLLMFKFELKINDNLKLQKLEENLKNPLQIIPNKKMRKKVIFLLNKASADIPAFLSTIKSSNLTSKVDYKVITSTEFDPAPFAKGDADVLAVNWGMPELVEEVLSRNTNIDWVHSFSAGVDKYMTPKIIEHPSQLTNTKDIYGPALAEFVAFAMLWFSKRGQKWLDDKSNKQWDPQNVELLQGKKLGIFGFGNIGVECAKIAKFGFGMEVTGLKRRPEMVSVESAMFADRIVGIEGLDAMLRDSDFVLTVAPKTKKTHGMFDREFFGKMKSSAVYLNIGRGETVNQKELEEALVDGVVAGAYLDVFEEEPLPKESKLFELENVYITPHCANCYDQLEENNIQQFLDNLERYRNREELKNVIDKVAGY
jgi:phosphoglycerate dehydrogenase-like enzyme